MLAQGRTLHEADTSFPGPPGRLLGIGLATAAATQPQADKKDAGGDKPPVVKAPRPGPPPATILAPAEAPSDLATALRLAGAENPQLQPARERVAEITAQRQLAAQLLPSLNVDTNYDLHRGPLQQSRGNIPPGEPQRPVLRARGQRDRGREGFRLEVERIREGCGLKPARRIEAIDSFRQWLESRQELLRALVGFDVAQFRLFVAVGNSPLADPTVVQPEPVKP